MGIECIVKQFAEFAARIDILRNESGLPKPSEMCCLRGSCKIPVLEPMPFEFHDGSSVHKSSSVGGKRFLASLGTGLPVRMLHHSLARSAE